MRRILALSAIVVISGCTTSQVAPNLPANLKLSAPDSYGNKFIDSIWFELGPEYANGNPAKCVALATNSNEYTLTDSVGSHFGAFTGTYYRNSNKRQTGGGDSLIYADKTSAIGKGNTDGDYTFGLVSMKKIVNYKVDLDISKSKSRIIFTDIKSALQSTGVIDNNGFIRAGAWPGAKPELVYDLLSTVASNLKSCLRS